MFFTYDRSSLCFLIVRRNWTFSRLLNRELIYHWSITELTAMCCSCCWIIFWITQYNTPRTFHLASYSVMFCDRCTNHRLAHWPLTLHFSPWLRCLGHKCYPFSYQLTSWFCKEVSTTCYFSCTLVPLRASRYTFFPLHLLRCYIHRSYQWTHPRGCEQACLEEPILL